MSSADGWGAFAQGFAGSYIESSKRTEKKKDDIVKIGASAFLKNLDVYNAGKRADDKLIAQAKAFAQSEDTIPDNAYLYVYEKLKGGITPAQILKDVRTEGGAWSRRPEPEPEQVTGMETMENPLANALDPSAQNVDTDVDTQTNDILGVEPTTDVKKEGVAVEEDKNNPFSKYRNDIMKMVGQEGKDDYFDMVNAGYTAPERTRKYDFTPGTATKQEKYTPNQIAVALAQQDPRWDKKDPTANAALVKEYVDATSKTDSGKTLTAAQMAVDLAMKSDGFGQLSPEEQAKVIGKFQRYVSKTTDGGDVNKTFTNSNFTAKEIQMKQWMTSTNPKEVEQAKAWFDGERQLYVDALENTAAIGKGKNTDKGDPLRLTVADEEGRTLFITATMDSEGNYTALDGQGINPDTILAVKSEDEAKEFNKMVTATQTITNEMAETRTSVVTATKELYELDKLVKENPRLLTLAAKGASAMDSAKNEVSAITDLIGQLGNEDPTQSSNSLIEQVAQRIDAGVKAGTFSKDMVEAYKVFSARLIRTVYATGRALGQQGNGFSNQDYRVILSSIVNANSYEAFSENLRGFGRTLHDKWSIGIKEKAQLPSIQTLLMYKDGRRVLESTLSTPDTYYGENGLGSSNANIYEWTQSKATSVPQNTVVEKDTATIKTQTPEEALKAYENGETIILTEELIKMYPALAGKTVGTTMKKQLGNQ